MKPDKLRRRQVLALAAGAAVLTACGKRGPRTAALPGAASVLALGDSLTQGVGAAADQAWPSLLAEASGWQVVNAGVSGDTSAQALARLPELLAEHQPALVIVSIGGNDFLRQHSTAATQDNIRRICELARDSAAAVLLVAVPGFSLLAASTRRLADHPLYAELADELRLPLYANGWSPVLSDPDLRADQVHANARGQQQFTDGLLDVLRREGWLA